MTFPSLNKKQKYIASASFLALAIAFGLGVYAFRGALFVPAPETETVVPGETPAPLAFRHPLTGAPLKEALTELPRVYAVMIDHSADAWPQSGVDDAFLVIEAPVEAGIPRLEAFFTEEMTVDKIGPVRSARPYFIDWANEFDALYVHVGGSNEALEQISTSGTFDFNQYWYGDSFWRSSDRYAPHNVYTSTELLAAAVETAEESNRAPEPVYGTWNFQDASKEPSLEGVDATIQFSTGSTYRAEWEYDEVIGKYRRIQGGTAYDSQEGDAVWADNVVVVITDVEVVDDVGRRHIRTIGEGEAVLFQNGFVVQAHWKKPSVSERLRFFDENGKELSMNAGKTWIEVVSKEQYPLF